MTEIEEDSVQRLGGSGRGGGVPTVVWVFVAVLVGVVGFAFVGEQGSGPPGGGETAAGSPPGASPSLGVRPPVVTPAPTPQPYLPPIPNERLDGAPRIVLSVRSGDDLELRSWRPGQAVFGPEGRISGAFAGLSDDRYAAVDLSPDGQNVAIVDQTFGQLGPESSRVRIAGFGKSAWESEELPYAPNTVWSTDGTMLAIGGGPDWIVVRIVPGEAARATIVRVAPPAEPSASPTPTPSPFEPYYGPPIYPVPVAFSADGRVLYGTTVHVEPPTFRPAIRVVPDPVEASITPIDRYPAGGPDGIAPTGYPGEQIDPATGRIAEIQFRESGPLLEIHAPPDEPVEVALPRGQGASLAWADGGLIVAIAIPLDANGEQASIEVSRVDADGVVGAPVLVAERVNEGWVAGSRLGFVQLGFHADEALLFVLLRASDGATATVRLRTDDMENLIGIDLVDPPPGR